MNEAGVPARWVPSPELKLDAAYVKVMTIHAAKGIEFPMACVAGVEQGVIPYMPQDEPGRADYLAQEQKLFYVGITRAMRRLLVCYPRATPSPFIASLDKGLWECRSGGPVEANKDPW